MNYAKWITYFEPDAKEGFTPEKEIQNRGGFMESAIQFSDLSHVGYISDNLDLSGLEKYNIQILSAEEALALGQSLNQSCSFDENGRFSWPKIDHISVDNR